MPSRAASGERDRRPLGRPGPQGFAPRGSQILLRSRGCGGAGASAPTPGKGRSPASVPHRGRGQGPAGKALASRARTPDLQSWTRRGSVASLRAGAGNPGGEGGGGSWGQGEGQRAPSPTSRPSPIVRRISDCADLWRPQEEQGGVAQTPGVCLLGARRGGRGTRAGRGFPPRKTSPLRGARPYLCTPAPRSRTCILKAPWSPGIGRGRVLRAQKLEPPGGGWGPACGPNHRAAPPRGPAPSRTPPETPNRTRRGAGPRLERTTGREPGGRPGAQCGGARAPPPPPPLTPCAISHWGRGRPRSPPPSARGGRGGPGSGSGAGGGLRLPRPIAEGVPGARRRRAPAQPRSPGGDREGDAAVTAAPWRSPRPRLWRRRRRS